MRHSGSDDAAALRDIRAGKNPKRPSEGIPDLVWQILQKCWTMDPRKRPSATQVYNALSEYRSHRPVIEDLPKKLKLYVQSAKISFNRRGARRVSSRLGSLEVWIHFKYGNQTYSSGYGSRTKDEYKFAPRSSPSSLLSLSLAQVR